MKFFRLQALLYLTGSVAFFTGCSKDSETGLWIRILSQDIEIDEVRFEVYDVASDPNELVDSGGASLPVPKRFTLSSREPENQLWILIVAGKRVREKIRIRATGYLTGHQVAEGVLEEVGFVLGKILHCDRCALFLEHCGPDKDNDGFCPPDDCDDDISYDSGVCQDCDCSAFDCKACAKCIHPEAREECGDDLDNDCDGSNDEDCTCTEQGASRSCWPHWASDNNCIEGAVGCPCLFGNQLCQTGVGLWSECVDAVLPQQEGATTPCGDGTYSCYATCRDNVDNDCDGRKDADDHDCGGCIFGQDQPQACYTGPWETRGVGRCQDGIRYCQEGGTWTTCQGEITPQPERCDLEDWNCNHDTDDVMILCEGNPGGQLGVCLGSTRRCVGGVLFDCVTIDYQQHSPDYRSPETGDTENCDGKDNDCDGFVDEECSCEHGESRPYSTNTGECTEGLEECIQGEWKIVQPGVMPSDELCDGKDSNCNGIADDQDGDAFGWCLENVNEQYLHAVLVGCEPYGVDNWICFLNCQYGYYDINLDLHESGGDGCEYPCAFSSSTDICDGKDNDCDGEDKIDANDPESGVNDLCLSRANTTISSEKKEACIDGVCQYQCWPTHADCDNDLHDPVPLPSLPDSSDGCETPLGTNDNCGGCFDDCTLGLDNRTCVGGSCGCVDPVVDCQDPNALCFQDLCCVPNCEEWSCEVSDGCGGNCRCDPGRCCLDSVCIPYTDPSGCGATCDDCSDNPEGHDCVEDGAVYRCGCNDNSDCPNNDCNTGTNLCKS